MFFVFGSLFIFAVCLIVFSILLTVTAALSISSAAVLLFLLWFFFIPVASYPYKNEMFWDINVIGIPIGFGMQMSDIYKKKHPAFQKLPYKDKKEIAAEEILELTERMLPGRYYFLDTHGVVMKNISSLVLKEKANVIFCIPTFRFFIKKSFRSLYGKQNEFGKRKCYFICVKLLKT